jgi:hypothetical protein
MHRLGDYIAMFLIFFDLVSPWSLHPLAKARSFADRCHKKTRPAQDQDTMTITPADLYWERHALKRELESLNLDEDESVATYQILVDNDERVELIDEEDVAGGVIIIEFDFTHIRPRTCTELREYFSDLRKKRKRVEPLVASNNNNNNKKKR